MGVKHLDVAAAPPAVPPILKLLAGPLRPIQEVYRWTPEEPAQTLVARVFRTADLGPDGCGRCGRCTAEDGPDGRSVCLVRLAGRCRPPAPD